MIAIVNNSLSGHFGSGPGRLKHSMIITAESLETFMPDFREVAPSKELAASTTDQSVSEMTVTITGGTCTIDHPAPLQADEIQVTLNIEDQNKVLYALTMFNLDLDKDILDPMASTADIPPSWADILLMEEQEPGTNNIYATHVEKGPVYGICCPSRRIFPSAMQVLSR